MCRFDDDPPQRWYDCPTCGGEGYTVHRITVYEHGCGFPHDDSEERPCENCKGAGGFLDDETPDKPEGPCPPIKMQEGECPF